MQLSGIVSVDLLFIGSRLRGTAGSLGPFNTVLTSERSFTVDSCVFFVRLFGCFATHRPALVNFSDALIESASFLWLLGHPGWPTGSCPVLL